MGKHKPPSLSAFPALRPGDPIGSGDSSILYDLLDPTTPSPWPAEPSSSDSSVNQDDDDAASDTPLLINTIFSRLRSEVSWTTMHHASGAVPRLVAAQGAINPHDGSKPVYRHPSDRSPPLAPFTPAVDLVRRAAEKQVGHELNHVLVQLYRDGSDFISEHSDKTLDVVRGSFIVNASFGAERTMRLRSKRAQRSAPPGDGDGSATAPAEPRETQRIPLPHNSLFLLSPLTNAVYLHSVPALKQLPSQLSPAELAYSGARISLTFRHIGTFLSADERWIWGQGATGKSVEERRRVVNGDREESRVLVTAMGLEGGEREDG